MMTSIPKSSEIRRRRTQSLVAGGVAAVIAATLLVATTLSASRNPEVRSTLGDDIYVGPRADAIAVQIATDGPVLLPDPLQGDRDLFIQHLSAQVDEGWVAILANAPGTERGTCVLQWLPDTGEFDDPCSDALYPASGAGLVTYPITVNDDGRLVLDLRDSGPGSTSSTTTQAVPE